MMLGELLRRDRERQGWRLARAAWFAGVTPARLRAIEDGALPSGDEWERLSDLYRWPKAYWPPH
jgi:predicted transcriptional regulator